MIAATLSGPNYATSVPDPTNIEVFDTLEDVIDMLRLRYMANGKGSHPVTFLDGHEERLAFPGFVEETTYRCTHFSDPEVSDTGKEEALEGIQQGWVDYICTLKADDEGEIWVEVRFA